jgi:prolyl-tRNA editing enzyme YbaK/EbsC (Cys-tRNA(Pro) deacylase)
MRSNPPVIAQPTLLDLETVYVNAGSRGFLIGIDPQTLIDMCQAKTVDVAVE